MTEQQDQWFKLLTQDRQQSADMLEKPSMRGVQNSVVDKYSDQAHFIFELLQNADDVSATSAHFILKKHGLYFIHNGTVRFTVSNPQNEEQDTASGHLGHINSITSIANSGKNEASIGKFGVGFKAVFQYTQTPHIYDPDVRFRIERFIVPHQLDDDLAGRQPSDTVFYFPFDHKEKSPQDSHDEIFEKLKALGSPVLFLSSLQAVSFEVEDAAGKYTKAVQREFQHADVQVQQLALTLELNDDKKLERLLVFSRKSSSGAPYSIGFALGNDGGLVPVDLPAFCFFPTKEITHLNFVIHAPFLLTDSREGIKAGEKHNQQLVAQLAELAADSLAILRDERLIDDGIFAIIPYDESRFSELDDRRKISFKPFFTGIENRLQSDALLPAAGASCVPKSRAYWAADTELVELFADEQLAQLTGTADARWVFRSRGRKEVQSGNKVLADYIDGGDARAWVKREANLIVASLDPEAVLKKISADFIARQSPHWLHKFYAYLSERISYQKSVRNKPIFLDRDGQAVQAFDDRDQLILFLPDADIDGYTTVNSLLLSNKTTLEFIENFGIKKPSLRDEIYNKILPAYATEESIDTSPHFAKFFRYFKECKNESVGKFISLIVDKKFLLFKSAKNSKVYRGKGRDIYRPTDNLLAWFEPKPDTHFLLLDHYREMVGEADYSRLDSFLNALHVLSSPQVLDIPLDGVKRQKMGLRLQGNAENIFTDKIMDGLDELLSAINPERSLMVWQLLVSGEYWRRGLYGNHEYHRPYARYNTNDSFESSIIRSLCNKAWILNQADELVSVRDITLQTLSPRYDTRSESAEMLIRLLRIRDDSLSAPHLSEEEARKVKLADEIERYGLSLEEIRTAIEDASRRKNASSQSERAGDGGASSDADLPLMRDIENRRSSKRNNPEARRQDNAITETESSGDEKTDADDYTPKPVDYGKKIERAKDRYASELDRLEHEQALYHKVSTLARYSYGWFLALLELECIASQRMNADSKSISIGFGKVERDEQSLRTIVLKEPSRFIPQSIEELAGVRVDLDFGNGSTGKLHVESFTAREFSLHGKLESADELAGIALDEVVEARIDVQNPSFLLQELLARFRELGFDEKFDMQTGLTPEIEFVFGPPGTGKTTHLAQQVLIPLMNRSEKERVLVLTPTNKAADVLTMRIIEMMAADRSYLDWLVRFGTSADERIDAAGVWRDRTFDIEALNRSVTITTIARLPYDGFTGEQGRKLYEMAWDTIIVDEASMISLASIIYPLYRHAPRKFIIAGDPFQIEPIVAVEQWRDQNIYTLVGLNKRGSFARPATQPHNYPVTTLATQYRSIPAIGDLYSRFTYDGILRHHRRAETKRGYGFPRLDAHALNLIKFPVSKYESIYRAKRLASGTPYQTYSALFTFEFVRWLSGQIQAESVDRVRIGVIAPYRAQANLLSRLIDSWTAKPPRVDIQVGTIHGFQGDECDIIVAVFNPPPTISTDSRMFLNKQNILNVAISRARDYLFIVMPDAETEQVENLYKIAELEKLVRAAGTFREYRSHDIEEIIWGNAKYLEENTFSTGHQMVNVYRRPERYYEVRSDDAAIDVQIHEGHREPE